VDLAARVSRRARSAAPAAGALLALLAAAAAQPADSLTLEQLMEGMASASGVAAKFREVKEVSLLSRPLETRGELYFVPPDRMARLTTEPSRAWLIVDGERVQLGDETGVEPIDLTGDPMASLFVENFVVLFRGDLDALRARYDVSFEARGDAWTLTLVPSRAPVDRFIESITLRGDARLMREMRVLEKDGDRVHTLFEDIEVDRRFSDAELRRLFSPPAAPAP
jgi:outer membrane lipoprotein-sorting protein